MVKQEKFKRLATVLHKVMNVLFWVFIVAAVISALGSVVMAFMPADYFLSGNTRPLLLSLDNVIKYRLTPPVNRVSLKPIFQTVIVLSTAAFTIMAILFKNLIGILKTVREDRPFARDNANRLTTMGVILLISSVVANVIRAAMVLAIVNTLNIPNIEVNFSFDLTMLLMGLLLLILAGVFRYGSYLQEEVDSTL